MCMCTKHTYTYTFIAHLNVRRVKRARVFRRKKLLETFIFMSIFLNPKSYLTQRVLEVCLVLAPH